MKDELDVALAVGRAFDAVGAAYFLGGSLASSLQGEPRSTNDLDFVAELRSEQVDGFADSLGADFDVDRDALRRAAREGSSWNLFHLPLVLKVDLFIAGSGPYDRSEMGRRRRVDVGSGAMWVKSPEDTILRKLLWYQEGGGVSDRQWRDVLGVLRVSGAALDGAYLDEWATRLGIGDLLARARASA